MLAPTTRSTAVDSTLSASTRVIQPEDRDSETKLSRLTSLRDKMMDASTFRMGIIQQYRKRLQYAFDYHYPCIVASKEDASFIYEDQWDESIAAERRRKNKPVITFNNLPQFIHNIAGNARMSRFGIKVLQKSGIADTMTTPDGLTTLTVADSMEGIIRDAESRSMAKIKYCRGIQSAAECGIAWFRVRTVRRRDSPFQFELSIDYIADKWSVLIDPYSTELDGSDANYIIVSTKLDKDDFDAKYPGKMPAADFDAYNTSDNFSNWWDVQGKVNVSEYFWKEPVTKHPIRLVNEETGEVMENYTEDIDDVMDELKERGFTRKSLPGDPDTVDTYDVLYAIVTGNDILEGPYRMHGSSLPVVPLYGRIAYIGNRTFYMGIIRYAKDPIRFFNYWVSKIAERMDKIPVPQWLLAARQIAGQEDSWSGDQAMTSPVLVYSESEQADRPQRHDVGTANLPELSMLNPAQNAINGAIGMYEANLGQPSNETSGAAISRRQEGGHVSTYDLIDNFVSATLPRIGQILCELAPKVYRHATVERLILDDESTVVMPLSKEIKDEETGKLYRVNPITLARFSVTTSVGPASMTQREQFTNMMLELGKTNPKIIDVMMDIIVTNQNMPGGREAARRLKRLLPREMLSEMEKRMMPPPEATPEQAVQMKEWEARELVAQADIVKAQHSVQASGLRLEGNKVGLAEKSMSAEAAMMQGGLPPEIAQAIRQEIAVAMADQDAMKKRPKKKKP